MIKCQGNKLFLYPPPQEHQSRLHHYLLQALLVPVAVRHWDRRRLVHVVVQRTCFSFRRNGLRMEREAMDVCGGERENFLLLGAQRANHWSLTMGVAILKDLYKRNQKGKRKTKSVYTKREWERQTGGNKQMKRSMMGWHSISHVGDWVHREWRWWRRRGLIDRINWILHTRIIQCCSCKCTLWKLIYTIRY